MSERLPAAKYVIDALSPFPARWRDHLGPLRVMAGPVQGYVMVKRPHAFPFCLRVWHLLNTEPHPTHGPFECLAPLPSPQEPQG